MFVRRRTSLSPAVESFVQFTLNLASTWEAISREAGRDAATAI